MPRKKREVALVHKMASSPGIQPRFDHSGREYRSFIVYDPAAQKPKRIPKGEVPGDIAYGVGPGADENARAFLKIKLAEHDAVKFRVQQRLEWQSKFYDFDELITLFEQDIPKYSPRNWENCVYYIKHFVLPFFLGQKVTNNMNNWPSFYEEFRDWLARLKPSNSGYGETYAISTQNHVISALNTWMIIMRKRGKVAAVEKCEKYPTHMLTVRGIDDVLTLEEQADVLKALKEIDQTSADFFIALRDGGFRSAEGFGLSANDVCEELPEDDSSDAGQIVRWLRTYDLQTYGYIQLTSQVDDSGKIRLPNGTVKRVPLKGRRTMNPEDGRMVPIFTKEFAEVIERALLRIGHEFERGMYGGNPSNYLLFDGLSYQKFSRNLQLAYQKVAEINRRNYKPKSSHCLRHTCATFLAGKTLGTSQVCRLVLGHKDDETTERYVHIWKSIMRDGQKKFQPKKRFRQE